MCVNVSIYRQVLRSPKCHTEGTSASHIILTSTQPVLVFFYPILPELRQGQVPSHVYSKLGLTRPALVLVWPVFWFKYNKS